MGPLGHYDNPREFEELEECLKCGYYRSGINSSAFSINFQNYKSANLLEIKCKRCNFFWYEYTKDYKEPEPIKALKEVIANILPAPKELTVEEQAQKEVAELLGEPEVFEQLVKPKMGFLRAAIILLQQGRGY